MPLWTQDAEKLLSMLISDEKAESLLDESLYDSADDASLTHSFDPRLTLKGIEADLHHQQYSSMQAVLRDVHALLSNATQILKQAPHIVELAEMVTQFERECEASTLTPRRRSARIARLKHSPVVDDSGTGAHAAEAHLRSPSASTTTQKTKKRKYSAMQQPPPQQQSQQSTTAVTDTDNSELVFSPNKKPRLSRSDTLQITPTPPRSSLSKSLSEPNKKKRTRRMRRKKRNSSSNCNTKLAENVNVNMHDNDNQHDDDDDDENENEEEEDDNDDNGDVEMMPLSLPYSAPPPIDTARRHSPHQQQQQHQSDSDIPIAYNLRNRSRYKLASSPSKSKTPILSSPPNTNTNKEREESVHSIQSSSIEIDLDDGTQDMMEGGFDGDQKMRYSCRGVCINGEYKSFNQDWISLDRFDQFKGENAVICTGVYDGHGILGHVASKYCARHIPKEFMFELFELHKQQNNGDDAVDDDDGDQGDKDEQHGAPHVLQQAVTTALHTIDTQLKEIACCESSMFSTILQRNGCASRLIDYGTTVNCLVSDGTDAFISNVGDSRCLLIQGSMQQNGKWTLSHTPVSADHNAMSRPDEQERVMHDGGKFFRLNNELRLYPKDRSFKDARRHGLAINMTRAVGHSTLSKYGLIAAPETYHVAIQPQHEYIFVAASDGLWDVVDNEQVFNVVQSIYHTFIHNQTNESIEDEIVMELIQCAQKKWRKKRVGDNISIVVTRIFNKL